MFKEPTRAEADGEPGRAQSTHQAMRAEIYRGHSKEWLSLLNEIGRRLD